MTAIGLLMKGMIGPTVCKYRVHVEHTRYRPQLETSHMQTIHERAFQMGEEDPLRTDYSRSVWIPHRARNALALTTIDVRHAPFPPSSSLVPQVLRAQQEGEENGGGLGPRALGVPPVRTLSAGWRMRCRTMQSRKTDP
jgi:hypothetical protein